MGAVENVVEEVIETAEHVQPGSLNLNGTSKGQQIGILVGTAVVSAFAGGGLAFYFTKKKLEAKYDEISRQEIEGAKEYYSSLALMREKPKTPEEMLTELHGDEEVSEVAKVVSNYQGDQSHVHPSDREEPNPADIQVVDPENAAALVEDVEGRTVVQNNIFEDAEPGNVTEAWDYTRELHVREENPDKPYIISQEEYFENETGYENDTLTYFEGDDTLSDDQDAPVQDTDRVVGDDNLTRFGHGSKDKNVVYIRNDQMGVDFEVLHSNGKFVVEVLGFDDPDELKHSQAPRRFRESDD